VRLLRAFCTLTLITRTIHTSLLCDCWELFVHSRLFLVQYTSLLHDCWQCFAHLWLLLVQYTQDCCAIVESSSHTHANYSYNTDNAFPRLLSALRTLTLINRSIQSSLMLVLWELLMQSRLAVGQYRQTFHWSVERSSYTWCNWTVYASCLSNWTVRVRARALMDQLHLNKFFFTYLANTTIFVQPWSETIFSRMFTFLNLTVLSGYVSL